jgi:hypothetical protein
MIRLNAITLLRLRPLHKLRVELTIKLCLLHGAVEDKLSIVSCDVAVRNLCRRAHFRVTGRFLPSMIRAKLGEVLD